MTVIVKVTNSPINYWAAIVTDAVAALAFAYAALLWYDGSRLIIPGLVLAGFLTWGLLEYLLHRWLLHGIFAAARKEHARHHGRPTAPISTPCLVIPFAMVVIGAMLASVVSKGTAAVFVFGMYAGYNYFAILHHLQHHHPGTLSRWRFFDDQLRLHEAHHQQPEVLFGISSSMWDRLFGTYPQSRLPQHDEVVVEQPGR